jgi:NAD(P)-dependent dehydrogenase (short-subunit alcohol dehydrogenase family)
VVADEATVIADLTDRVAVITGAGGGIGAALAQRFASEGALLVLADVDEEAMARTATTLRRNFDTTVLTVPTDVADADAVDLLAAATIERFGRVDVVCNNAGVVAGGPTWSISLEHWRHVIDVDLWGVINGVRSFVPLLLTQPEPTHVVNVGSMAGVVPYAGIAPYVVAKHGVVALSEVLARDLSEVGARVGVSVVCPGYVPSYLGLQDRSGEIPAPKPGAPSADDVASAVRDAIATDRFYVFTHDGSEREVRSHAKSITDGAEDD